MADGFRNVVNEGAEGGGRNWGLRFNGATGGGGGMGTRNGKNRWGRRRHRFSVRSRWGWIKKEREKIVEL